RAAASAPRVGVARRAGERGIRLAGCLVGPVERSWREVAEVAWPRIRVDHHPERIEWQLLRVAADETLELRVGDEGLDLGRSEQLLRMEDEHRLVRLQELMLRGAAGGSTRCSQERREKNDKRPLHSGRGGEGVVGGGTLG